MSSADRLNAVPDVKIDEGTFKYIQIKVYTENGSQEKIVIRGDKSAEYHADIYDSVAPGITGIGLDPEPIGGGRIKHSVSDKTLFVYGYSMGYGRAEHEITVDKLKKAYPDYSVTFSNDGY